MAEHLDLRKKTAPKVKIIYRTVVQQRSWYAEFTKVLAGVVIVSAIVWGVSKADIMQKSEVASPIENFSISGLVSSVGSLLSVYNATDGVNLSVTSYTFDASTIEKIETSEYVPLQFSDLQIGDNVIVQGISQDDVLTALRVISFTSTPNSTTTATTTEPLATTTPEVSTTTDVVSTSTDDVSSSTSTTTPSLIDAIENTIQNIIDTISGTTTGASSDATTTVATTTEEIITPTTTPEIIQDEPTTTPTTTEPVIDTSATDTGTSTESAE
jgi:hypothetical protein